MDISGWVRTSLIDYPEHIASVIFTPGCNFRCPMCHNADLVLHNTVTTVIPELDILTYLQKRAGLIDGLVITGGEPTLQKDLVPFLHRVKAMDMDVKLDTNGSHPDVVRDLLMQDLVDFIAMDIKAPPEKYHLLSGLPACDTSIIENSLKLIFTAPINFELRTTVVPHLLDIDDIASISQWLAALMPDDPEKGTYVLQQFRGLHTLDPDLACYTPYGVKYLNEMAETAKMWLPCVKVRGV